MNESTEKKTDLETVDELYQLLTKHELPEGFSISDLPPKMSGEQAISIIWFLQEASRVFPDQIERCDKCGELADSYCEHTAYIMQTGESLCEACSDSNHVYHCAICSEQDYHKEPGRFAVLSEEVQDLTPGLYRITDWPFYADGMFTMSIYEDRFERIGPIPDKADTQCYPIAFLCSVCERAIIHAQEGEH